MSIYLNIHKISYQGEPINIIYCIFLLKNQLYFVIKNYVIKLLKRYVYK